ncbi:hypothetical protein PMKS-001687 [Pichia membranifaciens]|uniref:Retrograde transport protein Dsl1 C-terminal domain-containing protein n=1 Tax=Pichia membranifaciens TaxID=4926 RepID=A0A1Q2YF87_9ASCO|nr:hypothetical protein PMKS-001687 [Pichia membranifaciens]
MDIQQSYSQDRLLSIDKQLEDIDFNLEKYFENYNLKQLCRFLEESDAEKTTKDAISEGGEHSTSSKSPKALSLQNYRKQDYIQLVELCNQLWIINGLVNELAHQTQFEDRVHSYLKLKSKTVETKKSIDQFGDAGSVKVLSILDDKINELKLELANLAQSKLHEYLSISNELDFRYKNTVEELHFFAFLKCCRSISSSDSDTLFNFNKLFSNWLQKFFDKLNRGFSAAFQQTPGTVELTLQSGEPDLLKFTESVEQLILFLNSLITQNESLAELKNIRTILGKNILKSLKLTIFSKENVYPLIIDKMNYDEHQGQKDSKVSIVAQLYKVSKLLSSAGWSKDGICELEFWIDDLTSSWIDNLLDFTIDELKLFVISLVNKEKANLFKESNLICKEVEVTNASQGPVIKQQEPLKESGKDDWGDEWGNNDAWNDDDDDDDDDEDDDNNADEHKEADIATNKSNSKITQSLEDDDEGWGDNDDLDLDLDSVNQPQDDTEDEDGWDAWEDEVKIDGEEDDKNVQMPTINKLLVPSYKYSKLVDEVMLIFGEYMKNLEGLKELGISKDDFDEAKGLFKHGFKKLCVSYFMLVESNIAETYQNEILFYNDYNMILEECYNCYEVDLTTCFKMSSRFINSLKSNLYSNISSVIEDYNEVIWDDNSLDNNLQLRKRGKEFLMRFDGEFDIVNRKLTKLIGYNTQLITNFFVTVIFQYFNSICDKVLARTDISSYESEILTGIINAVVTNTINKTKNLNLMVEKIQSYNKLQQIKLILSSNLKEILDAFCDAKLFEMETHELISLIQSLFIESPQRTDAITEIKTARDAQI